VENGVVRRRR